MKRIEQADDVRHARAWAADRKFAPTPFGEVAYVERGAGGGGVALFLHGYPLSSFQWRDVVGRLSHGKRCVALDFLGLGHTKVAPGRGVAFPDQVEMVAAFLDRLEVESVDLVANDSGTGVAQLFSARFPGRVRTLLLTNGDAEPDSPPPPLAPVIRMAKEGRFADELVEAFVRDKALARSPEGIGGLTYTDPRNLTDAAIDEYFAPLVASPERKRLTGAYAGAFDPNPLAGIGPSLRRCGAPARIVWGAGDGIFSPESPDYLDRLLPNSRGVRRVPGAKLFFPEEYPDVIAEEARALWAS